MFFFSSYKPTPILSHNVEYYTFDAIIIHLLIINKVAVLICLIVEIVLVVKMTSPVSLPARREIFIISDNLNVICCYHLGPGVDCFVVPGITSLVWNSLL